MFEVSEWAHTVLEILKIGLFSHSTVLEASEKNYLH